MSKASDILYKYNTLESGIVINNNSVLDQLTYENYVALLESDNYELICEGISDYVQKFTGIIQVVFSELKDYILELATNINIGYQELVKAFKDRSIFGLLKAVRFNLKLILTSIQRATGLIRRGILGVFQEIHDTGLFQEIKKGVVKLDDIIDRYPILKHVTGVIIAGLLIYIWLNMSFIGDASYDLDLSVVAGALVGKFSIAELFFTPSGMSMLALLALGVTTGIGAAWLGKSIYNLLLALIYTGYRNARDKDFKILKELKLKINKQI